MSLEDVALGIVNPSLQNGEMAEFDYGTLFLHCTEKTSRKVFSDLFMEFNGKVKISTVGYEYAIDFTA
jgi:hypothetical protein